MTLTIQEKSSNGTTLIPLETSLLARRKVFLEGEINEELANAFKKQILYLNMLDPHAPIDVIINSGGGEIVAAGLQMYDVIQGSEAPVRMFVTGRAYSMAAVLFASGNHGRFLLPNSELMIHQPLIENRVSGNATSIRSISESLMKMKERLDGILAKHTGRSLEEIAEATGYDHFFSAEEAVSFGLCDQIVDFKRMMEG